MKNNKKGFTLAEMLMVVGIVVILSGATVIGVVSWLHSAKDTAAKLEQENGDNFENDARKAVESVKGTAPSHVVNQTNLNTPAPTAKPTEKPTEAPKPTSKPNDPTPTTKPDDPTPTPVPDDPTPTPAGGNGGSSGGNSANFGTATNGFTGYANNGNPGLMSLTASGSNGISIKVTDGWDNGNPSNDTCTITITKNSNGKYTMSVTSGNGWVATLITGYNYQGSYELTSSDISNLQTKLGLKLS